MMHGPSRANPWVVCRQPPEDPQLRLLCLAYAGASGGVFRAWQGRLPDWIEVCPLELPGRWSRRREPLFTRIDPLVEAMAAGIEPLLDLPIAIFGHSLGALVGFELARKLRERQLPQPVLLFASARRAPQDTWERTHEAIHALPDVAFVTRMIREFGAFPAAVLRDPELLGIVVPPTRADVEVIETYEYRPEAPLACPITAFCGSEDSTQPRRAMDLWREQTRSSFSAVEFSGGHFFIDERRDEVLSEIAAALDSALTEPGRVVSAR